MTRGCLLTCKGKVCYNLVHDSISLAYIDICCKIQENYTKFRFEEPGFVTMTILLLLLLLFVIFVDTFCTASFPSFILSYIENSPSESLLEESRYILCFLNASYSEREDPAISLANFSSDILRCPRGNGRGAFPCTCCRKRCLIIILLFKDSEKYPG